MLSAVKNQTHTWTSIVLGPSQRYSGTGPRHLRISLDEVVIVAAAVIDIETHTGPAEHGGQTVGAIRVRVNFQYWPETSRSLSWRVILFFAPPSKRSRDMSVPRNCHSTGNSIFVNSLAPTKRLGTSGSNLTRLRAADIEWTCLSPCLRRRDRLRCRAGHHNLGLRRRLIFYFIGSADEKNP